jgi:hypothetical protein
MQLIARLFSFSEKKSPKSDNIIVPLLMASEFKLYFFVTIKLLIFNELNKLRSLFYSKFTLICAPDLSLAKVQYTYILAMSFIIMALYSCSEKDLTNEEVTSLKDGYISFVLYHTNL